MPDGVLFQVGTLKIGLPQAVVLASGAVFLLVALKLSKMYWRRRLTQWAESQRLQLVHFRGAWFYEGPHAWTRGRNQHLFRVLARDHEGRERSCWILFGTWWGFTWGEPLTEVTWDDEPEL
jgi:hypothetical protein